MNDDGDPAPRKHRGLREPLAAWKERQPAGRPKGGRNRLGELFLDELVQDFEANGSAAIVRCREERPHDYLRVIAGLLPKHMKVEREPFEGLSDDDLRRRILELDVVLGLRDPLPPENAGPH